MGIPTTPQEAAPAYDDVFCDHPVNGPTPPRSASAYAAIPQDDVELGVHNEHSHAHASSSSATAPLTPPDSLAQTIAGVFKPKPHVHCEQCDIQQAARLRRENERHCCSMVAATFMIGFTCALIFGIILVSNMYGKKHGGHE